MAMDGAGRRTWPWESSKIIELRGFGTMSGVIASAGTKRK
jgi:hypothetical protein